MILFPQFEVAMAFKKSFDTESETWTIGHLGKTFLDPSKMMQI